MNAIETREFERFIKQIQLDAWKQGMQDAIDASTKLARLYDDMPEKAAVLIKVPSMLTKMIEMKNKI